jgi:hypothetical protein
LRKSAQEISCCIQEFDEMVNGCAGLVKGSFKLAVRDKGPIGLVAQEKMGHEPRQPQQLAANDKAVKTVIHQQQQASKEA